MKRLLARAGKQEPVITFEAPDDDAYQNPSYGHPHQQQRRYDQQADYAQQQSTRRFEDRQAPLQDYRSDLHSQNSYRSGLDRQHSQRNQTISYASSRPAPSAYPSYSDDMQEMDYSQQQQQWDQGHRRSASHASASGREYSMSPADPSYAVGNLPPSQSYIEPARYGQKKENRGLAWVKEMRRAKGPMMAERHHYDESQGHDSFNAVMGPPPTMSSGYNDGQLERRVSSSSRAYSDREDRMNGQSPVIQPAAYESYGAGTAGKSNTSLPGLDDRWLAAGGGGGGGGKKTLWSGLRGKERPKQGRDQSADRLGADHSTEMERIASDQSNERRGNNAGLLRTKEGRAAAWQDVKAMGAGVLSPHKPQQHQESQITDQVGWLCANQASPTDWVQVMALAEETTRSEASAKEAVRALRKELKWGESDSQKRAIKLWALLMANCQSGVFQREIAQKKFLEALEHIILDAKAGLSVKEKLLETWAMFAYQYQDEPHMNAITKSYNKFRPSDYPLNGQPLNLAHEVFNLPSVARAKPVSRHRQALSQDQTSSQLHVGLQPHRAEPSPDGRSSERSWEHVEVVNPQQQSGRASPTLPRTTDTPDHHDEASIHLIKHEEDMQLLFEECQVARTNANLLIDVLTSQGLGASEVAEFSEKVAKSHVILSSQVEWASAQADRSRREVAERHSDQPVLQQLEETVEERLLAEILEANQELEAATSILGEAKKDEEEKEEERRVTELSKVDYRIDRSQLREDVDTGDLYNSGAEQAYQVGLSVPQRNGPASAAAGGSGSRSNSPHKGPRPLPQVGTGVAASTRSASAISLPTSASLNRDPSQSSAVRIDGPASIAERERGRMQELPRLPSSSSFFLPAPSLRRSPTHDCHESSDDDDSSLDLPLQPSEKALGKRRQVSVDETQLQALADSVGGLSVNGGGQGVTDRGVQPLAPPSNGFVSSRSAPPGPVESTTGYGEANTARVELGTFAPPSLPPLPSDYLLQRRPPPQQPLSARPIAASVATTTTTMQSNNPYASYATSGPPPLPPPPSTRFIPSQQQEQAYHQAAAGGVQGGRPLPPPLPRVPATPSRVEGRLKNPFE